MDLDGAAATPMCLESYLLRNMHDHRDWCAAAPLSVVNCRLACRMPVGLVSYLFCV